MGNVVRKLYKKLHQAILIRKCFKIGGTKSFMKKQKILFLERFWHISKSRKNLSFSYIKIRQHICTAQENSSLLWKALQIDLFLFWQTALDRYIFLGLFQEIWGDDRWPTQSIPEAIAYATWNTTQH